MQWFLKRNFQKQQKKCEIVLGLELTHVSCFSSRFSKCFLTRKSPTVGAHFQAKNYYLAHKVKFFGRVGVVQRYVATCS